MKKEKIGQIVSKGYGFGCVLKYIPYEPTIKKENTLDLESSIALYESGLKKAELELQKIQETLKDDPDKALIFGAHLEILNDIALDMMIKEKLETGMHPSLAVHESFESFIEMLSMVDDPLIQERVADLKDVKRRLLRTIENKNEMTLSNLSENVVVVAHDLFPSDTATMDKRHVKGMITEIGSYTSHSAIIARSYHIPAITGATNIMQRLDEKPIILDAIQGEIITSYDSVTLEKYQLLFKNHQETQAKIDQYLKEEAITKDGVKIEIHLNIESDQDEALTLSPYVGGVGLFRSEFLFMKNTHFPTEEEQISAYQFVSKTLYPKPVTLRSLDIGGDKTLSYFDLPKEENPFLGKRALRLCLDNLDIFKTQIKAALIASLGNIQLMFPMVGSIEDIIRAKEVVEICKNELRDDKIAFDANMKIGIMIEIPSIALLSHEVAEIVDFASIGTNDLTQYLHAVDRMNSDLKSYYQNYSVALFRLLSMISISFNQANKPLSICGELGGDPIGAPILIGLGYKKLSMSKSQVALIKSIIIENTYDTFVKLAQSVLNAKTESEVLELVQKSIKH